METIFNYDDNFNVNEITDVGINYLGLELLKDNSLVKNKIIKCLV